MELPGEMVLMSGGNSGIGPAVALRAAASELRDGSNTDCGRRKSRILATA